MIFQLEIYLFALQDLDYCLSLGLFSLTQVFKGGEGDRKYRASDYLEVRIRRMMK